MNEVERVAFDNAVDYWYYGYSYRDWKENGHNQGLNEEKSKEIWLKARDYLAKQ